MANKTLFGLGLVFLIVSFILSKELKKISEENKEELSDKLVMISKIINYTLVVFLFAVIYSFLDRMGVF